jgi:hypothetical protein
LYFGPIASAPGIGEYITREAMMEHASSLSENRVTYASGSNRSSGATEARKQIKRVTEANALEPGRSAAATGFFLCYLGSGPKIAGQAGEQLELHSRPLTLSNLPEFGKIGTPRDGRTAYITAS